MLLLPPVLGDVPPPFAVSYDLLALVAVVALVAFVVFLIRQKKRTRQRGWRVGSSGRDTLFYDEFRHGAWQRITIYGEMQFGRERPYRIIYLRSLELPEWARDRRQEIICRIKSEFREPEFEYQ